LFYIKKIIYFSFRAKIIDGKAISEALQAEIKSDVLKWTSAGHRRPHLTAVLVGDDPSSYIYIRNKMTAAKNVGMLS